MALRGGRDRHWCRRRRPRSGSRVRRSRGPRRRPRRPPRPRSWCTCARPPQLSGHPRASTSACRRSAPAPAWSVSPQAKKPARLILPLTRTVLGRPPASVSPHCRDQISGGASQGSLREPAHGGREWRGRTGTCTRGSGRPTRARSGPRRLRRSRSPRSCSPAPPPPPPAPPARACTRPRSLTRGPHQPARRRRRIRASKDRAVGTKTRKRRRQAARTHKQMAASGPDGRTPGRCRRHPGLQPPSSSSHTNARTRSHRHARRPRRGPRPCRSPRRRPPPAGSPARTTSAAPRAHGSRGWGRPALSGSRTRSNTRRPRPRPRWETSQRRCNAWAADTAAAAPMLVLPAHLRAARPCGPRTDGQCAQRTGFVANASCG